MTVQELIDRLSEFPSDMRIVISNGSAIFVDDNDFRYDDIQAIKIEKTFKLDSDCFLREYKETGELVLITGYERKALKS